MDGASGFKRVVRRSSGGSDMMSLVKYGQRQAWIALLLAAGACAPSAAKLGAIEIMDVWVASTVVMPGMAMNGAAYMVIWNRGNEPDRLVAAETDAAQAVELHQTVIDGQGIATMKPLTAVELPPNAEVRIEPGSYHLMLVAITREFKVGDIVNLSLTFEKAGTVELAAFARERQPIHNRRKP